VARPGARGLGFLPDGAPVLPTGRRLAVEVELHDKTERLGRKLAWYAREGVGDPGASGPGGSGRTASSGRASASRCREEGASDQGTPLPKL
jgi:hypothetical protein